MVYDLDTSGDSAWKKLSQTLDASAKIYGLVTYAFVLFIWLVCVVQLKLNNWFYYMLTQYLVFV